MAHGSGVRRSCVRRDSQAQVGAGVSGPDGWRPARMDQALHQVRRGQAGQAEDEGVNIEPQENDMGKSEDAVLEQAPASQATSLLQAITSAASNAQVDIEKMERLFAMHQKIVAQEAEAAFNGAMARAQANIQPVSRDAENTQTNSHYATLAAICKSIVP